MTLLAHVTNRLKALGVDCSVANDAIVIPTAERPTRIRIEEGWEEAFKQYRQARSLAFDHETRSLVHNASVVLHSRNDLLLRFRYNALCISSGDSNARCA